jgi:hypothetical protein
MQTHRDIDFADGVYRFKLGMGQIIAIEEKCGARIGAIYRHVLAGLYQKEGEAVRMWLEADFGAVELIEICRQGLIGGNWGEVDGREILVPDHKATHLVRTYLHPDNGNPLTKAWDMAAIILHTCVVGYEPAQEAAQKKSRTTKTRRKAASPGARSSATL